MIERAYEPVVLDLADDDDYAVLVEALEGYAHQLDGSADDGANAEGEAAFFRESARRARAMVERVHEQLDANAILRPPAR